MPTYQVILFVNPLTIKTMSYDPTLQPETRYEEQTITGKAYDEAGNEYPLIIILRVADTGLLGHAEVMGFTSDCPDKKYLKDDVIESLRGMFDEVQF